jgi:NhaA family Na+:H+ antiporter
MEGGGVGDEPGSARSGGALTRVVFARLERLDAQAVTRLLREESVGGALLLAAAAAAVVWVNAGGDVSYVHLQHRHLGPLSLAHWANDGLLTIFFFVAGLELKRELVVGSLRKPADALVPVVAAAMGMAVPAGIYLVVNIGGHPGGWAIPMATDIAFALAVLSVVGRSLPTSLRAFLLTLAIVDDLGAIVVIAVVFTSGLSLALVALAVAGLAAYAVLQHRRVTTPWVYVPLAALIWWATYRSGVHATVAGVGMGLLTRTVPDPGESHPPADRLQHLVHPVSAGFAVPVFAFLAAGVRVPSTTHVFTDPIVIGIVVGLFAGKSLGVLGGAYVTTRVTHARLSGDLYWRDVAAVATLSGVGFTVSLLIAELTYSGQALADAKTAVLAASVLSAVVAALLLQRRNRHHRSANGR